MQREILMKLFIRYSIFCGHRKSLQNSVMFTFRVPRKYTNNTYTRRDNYDKATSNITITDIRKYYGKCIREQINANTVINKWQSNIQCYY